MKYLITTALFVCAGLIACNKEPASERPDLLQIRTGGELVFGLPAQDCAECHPQHVAEWSIGPHAYAMEDPVFHAMVRLGQKQSKGKLGQFCVQCHSPIGLANNATPVVFDEVDGIFKQDTVNLTPLEKSGVSCDVCHSITDVLEPVNARAVLTPNGIRRATIMDPVETPAHASEYSELHETSNLCGMCHAVTNPKGAPVEETFPEWENSSFAERGETCQSCHMPAYEGQAATDGPMRTVHRHMFVGVDVSLLPPDEFPGYQELRDLSETLLRSALDFSATASATTSEVVVSLVNKTGHAVPSGATAERQMWIEIIVRDAANNVVFETGTLDENGDLRDNDPKHTTRPGTDPQLVYYGQQMIDDPTRQDPNSTAPIKPVTFPWQATWVENRLLAADGSAEHRFDLGDLSSGNYTASVRLLFRTFPMYFLKILEDEAGLDPAVKGRVPTVVMDETQLSFTVP